MVHAATIEELQAAWPDWNIWRANEGSWMATRRRTLNAKEMSEGLSHTLMEDTDQDLIIELGEQQRIENTLVS